MAFLSSLNRTFFLNLAKTSMGAVKQARRPRPAGRARPPAGPAHLVVEGRAREHHGHLVGPLGLVLPLARLVVPEVQAARVTHQPVRELAPDLRTETHQQSAPSSDNNQARCPVL